MPRIQTSWSDSPLWNSKTTKFFLQAEDGIRDGRVTGVQTCALPIYRFTQRAHRYEHGTARGLQEIARRLSEAIQIGAAHLRRQCRGRDRIAGLRGAKRDREQALVLRQAREELLDAAAVAGPNQVMERIVDRGRNQVGAHLEVAAEPAEHELVHQRERRVGEDGERDQQRDDESQRQSHGFLHTQVSQRVPRLLARNRSISNIGLRSTYLGDQWVTARAVVRSSWCC